MLLHKHRDTNGSRIDTMCGVYTTLCQQEGILLQSMPIEIGRVSPYLSNSVRVDFGSPETCMPPLNLTDSRLFVLARPAEACQICLPFAHKAIQGGDSGGNFAGNSWTCSQKRAVGLCSTMVAIRKILVSVKYFARNSVARNGCANFMCARKNCVLSAGKPPCL